MLPPDRSPCASTYFQHDGSKSPRISLAISSSVSLIPGRERRRVAVRRRASCVSRAAVSVGLCWLFWKPRAWYLLRRVIGAFAFIVC